MPPRRKPAAKKAAPATLSALIDSDDGGADGSESEAPAPKKAPTKKAPAARASRGRKKEPETEADDEDSGVEKAPAPAPKKGGRQSKAKAATALAPAKKGRSARKRQEESEPEEEEEAQQEDVVEEAPKKRGNTTKGPAKKKPEPMPEPKPEPKGKRMTKKGKDAAAALEVVIATHGEEIAETQFEPMDVDEEEEDEGEEEEEPELEIAPTPTQVHTAPPRGGGKASTKGRGKKAAVVTIQEEDSEDDLAHAPPVASTRLNSISHAEKKAERMEILERFQLKIQEDRQTSADKLLNEFKKNSAEQQRASDAVIKALQADLDAQTVLAAESKSLRKQISNKDAELKKLEAKVRELNKQVSEYQNESQVLQAKLDSAKLVQKTVPGSAMKGHNARAMLNKAAASNSTNADQDWITRAKDELFGDLTNLIIVNAKPDCGKRLFDCIQTGHNGTLNFKLSVRDAPPPKKPNGTNVVTPNEDDDDQHEYVFIPQLNPSRDAYVISLLPDYMRGEISFTRQHAARFYQKINSVLMVPRNPATNDDDEGETEMDDETMYTEATQYETMVDEEMED